jgi:thioester reductase-like protein
MKQESVLLTGAAGVVGSALLEEFPADSLICLTHRRDVGPAGLKVQGDVSEPRFGLTRAHFDELASGVGTVVHGAGITDFDAGDAAMQSVNVEGTRNVLQFAGAAGAHVCFVSTAFVENLDGSQSELMPGPARYLRSKREAERLVIESGLPACIVRPSIVVGDSSTGEISDFQGLHALATALLRDSLPLLPLAPEAHVDFVPQDIVARAVSGLSGQRVSGEFWLTAGETAPSVAEVVELTAGYARDRLGRDVAEPRFVEPEMVDRLIRPAFVETFPPKARHRFDQMVAMTSLFRSDTVFPTSLGNLEERLDAQLTFDPRQVYEAALDYISAEKDLVAT